MPGPALARNDEAGDRLYVFGNPPEGFYSSTTIINGGVPKYLVPWAAKLVAELAHEALTERGPNAWTSAVLRRLAAKGRSEVLARQAAGELKTIKLDKLTDADLALRWLKGTPDRVRDAAAELGTDVHDEAERLVLQQAREGARLYIASGVLPTWDDRLAPHMASFTRFLEDWHPEYLATELTVFNRTQGYAGTLDAIMRITFPDGRSLVVLVDYKSGRAIYPEVALQLASYARAEFAGHPDGVTELPMPAVDAGAVLHLTPKGYRLRLVRIDDQVFNAFLYARETFRWVKETSRSAFLQELIPTPAIAEVA